MGETNPSTLEDCIKSCGITPEDWYKNLYEGSPIMYRMINVDGIIIDCNRAYVKALGYSSKKDLIGTSIFDSTAEQSLGEMHKTFETWRKSGHVQNREVWLKRKDGTIFPVLLNASSIFDEMGTLVASNTAITNVAEIYNARKSLERANSDLRNIEQSKDEFIAMISHELKTPLLPMRLHVDKLLEQASNLSEKQLKALRSFERNLGTLGGLVGDVLDVYKLDMGKLKFNKMDVPVDDLINDIAEELVRYLRDKNIQLEKDIRTAGNTYCDQKRVGQVISNLVKNSVDFIPDNGGKIVIRAEENGDSLIVITVEDNGPGIPLDKVTSLFKKFYYVDTSATRKHGGSGLGLSICKGIVEAHGGSIWLDTSYTRGAAIKFTLPMKGDPI
jgi:PAS domain S-box-containing protein